MSNIDKKQTSNSGQAFWLAIANLISFSFGIVSSAILSRYLTVSEYGSYKQVLYIYTTLLTVFTLGLPRAYSFFLARLPIEQGYSVVNKINGIFVILGAIFSTTLFVCAPLISSILKNDALTELLRWFAPTPLLLLPIMGIESIMATYHKAKYATIYIVLSRVFTLACVVIPVLIWSNARVAVIGFTLASALSCIAGIIIERKPFRSHKREKTTLQLRSVFKYSIPLLFASGWGILAHSAPQFFISRWYGNTTFAEFSNGFIELPFASMIIGAVATVLLPAFSRLCSSEEEKKNNIKEILRIWNSSFLKSAKIIYPIAIFACVFAKPIMLTLYGNAYSGATIYFQIITGINISRIIQYGPILMALNQTKLYANLQMICAIMVIGLSFIYVEVGNLPAYGIAIIYTASIIFLVLLQLKLLAKALKVKTLQLIPLKELLQIALISIIATTISYIILYYITINNPLISLVIAGLTTLPIFFIGSKIFKIDYNDFIHLKIN